MQAADHMFVLKTPYQWIDYTLNKQSAGVGLQYQYLVEKSFAPGIEMSYQGGIYSKTTIAPLYSIFIIKPTITYYLQPDFKRFYFEMGFGYAFIKEANTSLQQQVYVPFKDQFHYSFAAGYLLPIKKCRLGVKTEIGGYTRLSNTAPAALFIKGEFQFAYCLIRPATKIKSNPKTPML